MGNDGIFAINLRALPNLQSFRFAAADDLKAAWFLVEREDSEGSVVRCWKYSSYKVGAFTRADPFMSFL